MKALSEAELTSGGGARGRYRPDRQPNGLSPTERPTWTSLEQFQEKCETVFRPELRQNKELEQVAVSVKR